MTGVPGGQEQPQQLATIDIGNMPVSTYDKDAQALRILTDWPNIQQKKKDNLEIPFGPVSSIPGKPEVRIFKTPDIYPIKGFDVSSADGFIDWGALITNEKPRFVYTRLVGWEGVDSAFKDHWSKLSASGIDRGAYLKYDFCKSVDDQFDFAKSNLAADHSMLPVAIFLVQPTVKNEKQFDCFNKAGLRATQDSIRKFAGIIWNHYGKTPVLYGNQNDLSSLLNDSFDRYMVWVGYWGINGEKMSGRNPWTLWQYSGDLVVHGIGPKSSGEVFFGTEKQYALFKEGKSNVALEAVK